MEYQTAREKLIEAWGTLGSSWGVNRTMAQIHALLMISPKALSTEEIMEQLSISRGNANMNLRALLDWGIVHKELHPGERKEYFKSEKDVWELARKVAEERKKRELEPLLRVLEQVKQVEGPANEQTEQFRKITTDLHAFAQKSDKLITQFIRSDENWFVGTLLKLIK
jgi:DNA-binding transcriptional regulator GbsR (MarR family)